MKPTKEQNNHAIKVAIHEEFELLFKDLEFRIQRIKKLTDNIIL